MATVKIYFYRITKLEDKGVSLKRVLEEIEKKPLAERCERFHRSHDLNRMEHSQQDGNYWYCDFTRIRMEHGPGKASPETESQSIEIKRTEGFTEATAVLFDTANDCAVIQYNHAGMRPESIKKYLNRTAQYHDTVFDMHAIVEASIHSRAFNRGMYKTIEYKIDTRLADNSDMNLNVSAGDAIRMANKSGADVVTVKLGKRSGKESKLENISDDIKWLVDTIRGPKAPMIDMAKITAKDSADDVQEPIDLLEQRIFVEKEVNPHKDERQLPRLLRFAALTEAIEERQVYVKKP